MNPDDVKNCVSVGENRVIYYQAYGDVWEAEIEVTYVGENRVKGRGIWTRKKRLSSGVVDEYPEGQALSFPYEYITAIV